MGWPCSVGTVVLTPAHDRSASTLEPESEPPSPLPEPSPGLPSAGCFLSPPQPSKTTARSSVRMRQHIAGTRGAAQCLSHMRRLVAIALCAAAPAVAGDEVPNPEPVPAIASVRLDGTVARLVATVDL